MSDEHVTELLPGYAEEALEPDVRERVLEHLAACPDCRTALAAIQSEEARDEPSSSYLDGQDSDPDHLEEPAQPLPTIWRPIAITAIVAMLIVTGAAISLKAQNDDLRDQVRELRKESSTASPN